MTAASQGESGTVDKDAVLLASIRDYVVRLLNSREGSTLTDPGFGMPDFTHSGAGFSADDEPRLRQKIAEFIGRNEPRLSNVRVVFAPQEGNRTALTFSIEARLAGEAGDKAAVRLHSSVSQQGKVDVHL